MGGSQVRPGPTPAIFPPPGQVAQLVEHVTENHGVGSSILPLATPHPSFDLPSSGALRRRPPGPVVPSLLPGVSFISFQTY
jgi:hypothetical protein